MKDVKKGRERSLTVSNNQKQMQFRIGERKGVRYLNPLTTLSQTVDTSDRCKIKSGREVVRTYTDAYIQTHIHIKQN